MKLLVGDRVRYTEYALRDKWNYWQKCGREPQKSNAERGYREALAIRGTVIEVLPSGVRVQTDGGAVHSSLSYLWEVAEN